jgi:5-(carboxyamino)imidazole ribonucleotide synthase
VLGGGQLGRMFVHAAQRMGYFTAVLDPDADSPAGRVSHHHIHTDYGDVDGLARLAGLADAVTTEFENVPAPSLEHLAVARPVSPEASAIAIAQDRIAEKAHFTRCGVPCAPYAVIETAAQLAAVGDSLLPGILKTARLGYDGKGQQRVKTRAELVDAWQAAGCVPCVLEKMLPLEFECSVILARGRDGQIVHFPPQRNLHRDGILAVTEVHAQNMPKTVAQGAVNSAKSIANGLGYVGVLCVEFFALADGSLVVNEMAPRRTTAATTRWKPATCRSSSCRCARSPACRWPHRASTARPSCSTCWATCGFPPAPTSLWCRAGARCSRCPAPTCTCTARSIRAAAARWAT